MIYYQIKMGTGLALSVNPEQPYGGQFVLAAPEPNDEKQLWGLEFSPEANGFAMVNKLTGQVAEAKSNNQGAAVVGATKRSDQPPSNGLATWTLSGSSPGSAVRPVRNSDLNLNARGDHWRANTQIIIYSWGGGAPNERWSFAPVGEGPPPKRPDKPDDYYITMALLDMARTNEGFGKRLATDAAHLFAEAGYRLRHDDYASFQAFFQKIWLRQRAREETAEASVTGCDRCTVAMWGIAASVVFIGAAALPFLTEQSSFVVGFAETFKTTPRIALAFLVGLNALSVFTISSVALELCNWVGLCKKETHGLVDAG